jgi:MFS transporter, UMF1 family
MIKGDKKVIRGWVFYDWANSVYNLVISSAVFPIFYDVVTKDEYGVKNEGGDSEQVIVSYFGYDISSSALLSFVLAASFLAVSFLSPLLSGIADRTGNKKRFLKFFCYFGAISCATLFFFDASKLEICMFSVFFASIGFWNSLVFYNAFLPEIVETEDLDKVSAKGFSMGYFGSMLLLIICLVLMQGFGVPAEYCFILVALWWAGFSQITYRALPNNVYNRKKEKVSIWKGFAELRDVFIEFKTTKRLKKYLFSFFFFNTGVQTVMLMATIFANKAVTWPEGSGTSGLITAILLIQILGAAGAFLMSRLSNKIGNIKTLIVAVVFWIFLCLAGYLVHTPFEFYFLAAGVGLVMGGVQSIARSTYSKFLPETQDHASYFSFYDVTEKLGIVMGLLFFGLTEMIMENIRYSVISVAFFFVIGLILLFLVPKEEVEMGGKGLGHRS